MRLHSKTLASHRHLFAPQKWATLSRYPGLDQNINSTASQVSLNPLTGKSTKWKCIPTGKNKSNMYSRNGYFWEREYLINFQMAVLPREAFTGRQQPSVVERACNPSTWEAGCLGNSELSSATQQVTASQSYLRPCHCFMNTHRVQGVTLYPRHQECSRNSQKKKKKNRFANMSGIDLPSHGSTYVFVIKMDRGSLAKTTLYISPINISKRLKQYPLILNSGQKSPTLTRPQLPSPGEMELTLGVPANIVRKQAANSGSVYKWHGFPCNWGVWRDLSFSPSLAFSCL